MNPLGAGAIILSVVAFAVVHTKLRPLPLSRKLLWLGIFTLLSIPAVWFAVYYLHVVPEYAWFYTLRSWTGTEFFGIFLGCGGGAFATLLPRFLLGVPLFGALALSVIPYMKPLLRPLPDHLLHDRSQGDVCLQSTRSTCGPASIATILRRQGVPATEREIARAAYTYAAGTEAWYLARYVRSRGFATHFDFGSTFSPEAGQPSLIGVHVGSIGHFIAVLDFHDGQITYVDPMHGERKVSHTEFQRRYKFTGFHMVISRD